ncbi:hypothetical protein HOP50_02g13800 [Chloropicon primus]|uniref:NIPSNAP domain-containing protein n=1 Tax=Chloropicon primus TaxID=1764295 RepID=A0A5B8MGR5_9CHLO|nr:hypothetical protein A3770_02p13930 [Chloropicon primus]UPQ98082.1 hypothetical protein HOP50_02g13800 [Chloropicon primus]|eukprot:QDZ18875.1 hypothetical protein A3770_02p13930 [Chloropicon primus]
MAMMAMMAMMAKGMRSVERLVAPSGAGGKRFLSTGKDTAPGPGLLEWRTYKIKYEGMGEFMRLTEDAGPLRKALHPGWLGFFTADTGGCLTSVHHIYHYEDMVQRKEVRDKAGTNEDWKKYRVKIGPHVLEQESAIFKPAVKCMDAAGSSLVQDFEPEHEDGVMYELRKYQLHPGYDSVPRLLDSFAKGLPHKVAADSNSKLVFFGFIDVGMLNTVIEVWRYPSLQASIQARESARKVKEWKECINSVTPSVQHFRTQALFPTTFSPLR